MNQTFKLFSKPLIAVALLGTLGAPVAFAQQNAAPAARSATVSPVDAMKAELKIKPTQESDWKKFVDAYSMQFKPSQMLEPEQFNALKTPDRVAFLKMLHSEQNSFIFNRFDASVALYKVLDSDQKQVFDAMTAERSAAAPAKPRGKK